ncbi:hypothetical protein P154DRAFT_214623 [Amniculicola lignicola CBS 123094]|uniref:DUF676 domain-containing protein n=1 Tax=Amniculicola lignicola CBS 123094 TaxID=1392246 RepID=A0A6A5WEM7_9PLEO|nr:hypothetical protein P154DRAFT_214623 [Amniculicola lignicola CBS 123094]
MVLSVVGLPATTSQDSNSYQLIFQATQGIIFLGTPHHGSSYASLGRRFARIIRFISRDTNVGLLRSMEEDSEILERISEDFRITLARKDIKVCSFVEELSMSSLLDPVVLPKSGYIGVQQELRGTIHANHRDMCRFKDARDPGFVRIVNVIFEMVAAAIHPGQRHHGQSNLPNPDLFGEEEDEEGGPDGWVTGRDPYLQTPEPSLSRESI